MRGDRAAGAEAGDNDGVAESPRGVDDGVAEARQLGRAHAAERPHRCDALGVVGQTRNIDVVTSVIEPLT